MICKNCQNDFEGKFCNICGQKVNTQRINFAYLADEFSNSVLQVNRGIFYTIKELFVRPGHSIREFLEGKRKQHFKPLAFVLLISAIYLFVAYLTDKNTILADILEGWANSDNNYESTKSPIMDKILNWLNNNYTYYTLLLLPIFSLASYLSFIRLKYNYVEHLVLNSYVSGQQMLIYLIFTVISYVTNIDLDNLIFIPLIITIFYIFWTFDQFFESKKIFTKILLTVLTYALYFVFIGFVMILLALLESFLNNRV